MAMWKFCPSLALAVLDSLQGNQRLRYLNLANNRLGEMGEEQNLSALTQVKRFLDECESLTHVDLSGGQVLSSGGPSEKKTLG